jgi:hypothetical protein
MWPHCLQIFTSKMANEGHGCEACIKLMPRLALRGSQACRTCLCGYHLPYCLPWLLPAIQVPWPKALGCEPASPVPGPCGPDAYGRVA